MNITRLVFKIKLVYKLLKNNHESEAAMETLADALESKIRLENSGTCSDVHIESYHPMYGEWFDIKELPNKILQRS